MKECKCCYPFKCGEKILEPEEEVIFELGKKRLLEEGILKTKQHGGKR